MIKIVVGDCRDVLRGMADESVHCVVTSPPYWRQRDYGGAPSVWGGNAACDHQWTEHRFYSESGVAKSAGAAEAFSEAGPANAKRLKDGRWFSSATCSSCGGWLGQLGLEPTPEQYIANMVEVFRAVHRVLRSDGTAWINIGDKWASGGNGGGGSFMAERGEAWVHAKQSKGWRKPPSGYKDKDLVGVPFMLAFAMRADGWFWRQCNVWAKPNGAPESVRDRSTISHEYVLHFSKRNDYWYDNDAARTPATPSTETRVAQDVDAQAGSNRANGGAKTNGTMKAVARKTDKQRGHSRKHQGLNDRWDVMERKDQLANGANLRSVWWIAPANYREGHYAVMPDTLVEICIVAGCPKDGTVLDPFAGAGTVGLVADRLKRDAVLIELNPAYAEMARSRLKKDGGMFSAVEIVQPTKEAAE
jgi:DNA modification methylase